MILKKIIEFSVLLFFYFLSPILYIIIKLFKPFKIIRVIPLLSNRYGHLVINPEFYLIEKLNDKNEKKYYDLFYTVRYGVANNEVLKLWKKKIKILPYYFLEPLHRLTNKFEKMQKKE